MEWLPLDTPNAKKQTLILEQKQIYLTLPHTLNTYTKIATDSELLIPRKEHSPDYIQNPRESNICAVYPLLRILTQPEMWMCHTQNPYPYLRMRPCRCGAHHGCATG